MLQVYQDHDAQVSSAAARMGATCREGCAHCCMLPATATVPEMAPAVDHLASRADWSKRRPALERALTRHLEAFAGVDVLDARQRDAFFGHQLPCVFLTKDRRCSIYPVRPAVCRYHLVVSPAENCALGAADPVVARIDLSELETGVALRGAQAIGELVGGPIALAFVLAADRLGVRLAVDRALVRRTTAYSVAVPAARIATSRDR